MFFHILFTRPIGWDNRGIHIGACAFSMRVPLLTRCQVFFNGEIRLGLAQGQITALVIVGILFYG